MTAMTRRFHSSQDGIALVTALLAVLIIGGLVAVMMSRIMTETRVSASSRDYEVALHAAEGAVDDLIAKLNQDTEHHTVIDGTPVEPPADGADERAWLRGWVETADGSGELKTGGGFEALAIRPSVANPDAGEPDEPARLGADVIYAYGAVPAFDHPRAETRWLRLRISQDHFAPPYALMTDGNFNIGGNAEIRVEGCDYPDNTDPDHIQEHCVADVHTNKDIGGSNAGNAKVEGLVSTVEGSCPSGLDGNAANGCHDSSDGVSNQPVPPFTAEDFYRPEDEHQAEWYDLCPDGKIREGSPDGPCDPNATEVWPKNATGKTSFRGWEPKSGQGTWEGHDIASGVFYVHHNDASIRNTQGGDPQTVSVLASEKPGEEDSTGSIDVAGSTSIQAAMDDVLLLADRDMELTGGSKDVCGEGDLRLSGFIGTGEQIKIAGNVELKGAAIVRDKADDHGLVKRNNDGLDGTMCLEYDQNLVVDFTGLWVIEFWNEF